jgi:hypothetical protein
VTMIKAMKETAADLVTVASPGESKWEMPCLPGGGARFSTPRPAFTGGLQLGHPVYSAVRARVASQREGLSVKQLTCFGVVYEPPNSTNNIDR